VAPKTIYVAPWWSWHHKLPPFFYGAGRPLGSKRAQGRPAALLKMPIRSTTPNEDIIVLGGLFFKRLCILCGIAAPKQMLSVCSHFRKIVTVTLALSIHGVHGVNVSILYAKLLWNCRFNCTKVTVFIKYMMCLIEANLHLFLSRFCRKMTFWNVMFWTLSLPKSHFGNIYFAWLRCRSRISAGQFAQRLPGGVVGQLVSFNMDATFIFRCVLQFGVNKLTSKTTKWLRNCLYLRFLMSWMIRIQVRNLKTIPN
jgi:hypothetical protein